MPRSPRTPRAIRELEFASPGPANADLPVTSGPGGMARRRATRRGVSPGGPRRTTRSPTPETRQFQESESEDEDLAFHRRERPVLEPDSDEEFQFDEEKLEQPPKLPDHFRMDADDIGTRISMLLLILVVILGMTAAGMDLAITRFDFTNDRLLAVCAASVFTAIYCIVMFIVMVRRTQFLHAHSETVTQVGAMSPIVYLYYGMSYAAMITPAMNYIIASYHAGGLLSSQFLYGVAFLALCSLIQTFAGFSKFAQNTSTQRYLEYVFVQGHSFLGLVLCAAFYMFRETKVFVNN